MIPGESETQQKRQFSCFSKTLLSLSRIDICLCMTSASQHIEEVQYLTRSISDHSPLAVRLTVRSASNLPRAPWKQNAFWLNLFPSHTKIATEITAYWQRHADYSDLNAAWDAFKEFLRGLFISEVNSIKRKVRRLEAEYIANSGEGAMDSGSRCSQSVRCLLSR